MNERKYIILILFHVIIGVLVYFIRPLSMMYAVCIPALGLYYVMKTQNRNNEVLLVAAYIVGSEVFLRMTDANLLYESSKYGVMIFLALGMYYSGFSKDSVPFWIYLLLLLPGVFVATETLNIRTDIRKAIAFNISGPVCLGIAAIYCFNRKILLSQLNNVLLSLGLPIFSTTVYLILYTPNLKEILTGTGSNNETSGGFGPNQVATLLGIGMFVFFSRLLLESKSKLMFAVNLIILFNITYRGLVTFSRGGMVTGFIMIIILLFYLFLKTKGHGRYNLFRLFIFLSVAFFMTWLYTSNQTGGLINKRYANQDAAGREKESQLTGREKIWDGEIDDFLENPIFGVGVAKALEIRTVETGGLTIASHSEISRTLAEHGAMGIIALLIVFFTPIFLFLDNKQNIYAFCFILFWLLTINHAAMRIAAPAFVYSLSLLKVFTAEEPSLHRE
ncbi:O-antigen ligase family protein [Flavobacterium paronense]|uniref:O-antigen ligase family protein n=1 Tax=Flavobacterium paronense TaxID=1392775 RepID=A0ABV5GC32_9FLAO|nr:O-antigen ligase family protein [Flavobacterium paronense]MDN3676730.1 O-antigen ligase family protein [Flavobacterium paronense]